MLWEWYLEYISEFDCKGYCSSSNHLQILCLQETCMASVKIYIENDTTLHNIVLSTSQHYLMGENVPTTLSIGVQFISNLLQNS